MIMLYVLLGVLFVINCVQLYKLCEKLDCIQDTLLDLDIIYIKLQQLLRGE